MLVADPLRSITQYQVVKGLYERVHVCVCVHVHVVAQITNDKDIPRVLLCVYSSHNMAMSSAIWYQKLSP